MFFHTRTYSSTFNYLAVLPWGSIVLAFTAFVSVFLITTQLFGYWWPAMVAYSFLPMFFANMAPPGASKLAEVYQFDWLNHPIWPERLGRNKTWRGLLVAMLTGMTVALVLFSGQGHIPLLASFAIPGGSLWLAGLIGLLQGFGAMFGDAIGSYFKRHLGILEGVPWYPFDYADLVIGTALVYGLVWTTGMVTSPSFAEGLLAFVWLIALSITIIPVLNWMFVAVGIKKSM